MRYAALVIAALLFAGCSSVPRPAETPSARVAGDGIDLTDSERVRAALREQHEAWRGVPYRLGGNSRGGIDCSAFVVKTFRAHFGLELPRVTEQQAWLGRSVPRDALRAGDLVFFKTGWKQRHVGIYIADSRFVHASTSAGVTVSNLRNPYWAGHYWRARRIRVDR